jgi:hypothetical protein
MALSLVDIKNNKLILNRNLETEHECFIINSQKSIKVVSIIGKARTGKSSFLNCLISFWENDSKNVFQMSNTDKHCTNGIDMYYLQEKGILLLDFQGIWVENSSNDSKLLLLAYLMSDIIIFNETKMLTNGTLAQFEPMLAFINDIKGNNDAFNPKLIFRVGDVSLEIEPTNNMRQMLNSEDDQFNAIRECIGELFDDPYAINTFILDRKEIALMNKGKFSELLKIKENGFEEAITKIDEYLEGCKSNKTIQNFFSDIFKNVKCINNNKKIDFKKLDVVQNLAKNEISEYISKLDKKIYAPLIVDGTIETYNNVIARQDELYKIIKTLEKEFKSIPKTIRDEKIHQLKTDIDNIIEIGETENKTKAEELINSIITKILHTPSQFTLSESFTDLNKNVTDYNSNTFVLMKKSFDNWIKPFVDKINLIIEQSNHIHESAVSPFKKWSSIIIKDIKLYYETECRKYNQLVNSYLDKCTEFSEDFKDNLELLIKDIVEKCDIIQPYNELVSTLIVDKTAELNEILRKTKLNSNEKRDICCGNKIYTFTISKTYNEPIIHNISYNKYNVNTIENNTPFNSVFQDIYSFYNTEITNILYKNESINKSECNENITQLITKYRNKKLTNMGYIDIFSERAVRSEKLLSTYMCRGQPIKCLMYPILELIINNNPDIQFYTFNFSWRKGETLIDGRIVDIYNIFLMTQDHYKTHLEQDILRTFCKLFNKEYLYDDQDENNGGWSTLLKNNLLNCKVDISYKTIPTNLKSIDFQQFKSTISTDYKKNYLFEIFERKFKKEHIRSGVKDYIEYNSETGDYFTTKKESIKTAKIKKEESSSDED